MMIEYDERHIDRTTYEAMIEARDLALAKQAKEISELHAALLAARQRNVEDAETIAGLAMKCADARAAVKDLRIDLVAQHDPMGNLIQANRMLTMHEEAVRRVRKVIEPLKRYERVLQALEILDALNLFHPMHPESFPGWPEESE